MTDTSKSFPMFSIFHIFQSLCADLMLWAMQVCQQTESWSRKRHLDNCLKHQIGVLHRAIPRSFAHCKRESGDVYADQLNSISDVYGGIKKVFALGAVCTRPEVNNCSCVHPITVDDDADD